MRVPSANHRAPKIILHFQLEYQTSDIHKQFDSFRVCVCVFVFVFVLEWGIVNDFESSYLLKNQ